MYRPHQAGAVAVRAELELVADQLRDPLIPVLLAAVVLTVATYSDVTYYVARSGAGAFASGTEDWICALPGDGPARRAVTGPDLLSPFRNRLRVTTNRPAPRQPPGQAPASHFTVSAVATAPAFTTACLVGGAGASGPPPALYAAGLAPRQVMTQARSFGGTPAVGALAMLTAAGGLGKHFCSATQLVFRCGGYTAGTSGSPLLAHVHAATGLGTVIGVIGGCQQGGVTDAISYAAVLGPDIASLDRAAIAGP